jgi:hypothetical protein
VLPIREFIIPFVFVLCNPSHYLVGKQNY